jgi:hypothetical protein
MNEKDEVERIAKELCELLEQQMKTITRGGMDALSSEELAKYKERAQRISALRSQLSKLKWIN